MPQKKFIERLLRPAALLIVALCAGCTAASPTPVTGPVATHYMVAAANPVAAQAGLDVLRRGGTAADAAVAVQMMLNVVEPQASGLGGGGLLMYYDAASRTLHYYDGRETAPHGARPDMFLDADGKPLPFQSAVASGRSVGVPGTVQLLDTVHRAFGRLAWGALFAPAIVAADKGVRVSPRLAHLLGEEKRLPETPAAKAIFYHADGSPKRAGETMTNPVLADTLRRVARGGPDAFYSGPVARDIVAAVHAARPRAGTLSVQDLANYRIVESQPLCGPYRAWRVCSAPPVSSGGLAILQTLGMLQHFDLGTMPAESPEAVHLIAEASRLAFADRDRYVGDPAFVDVPLRRLLDPAYIAERAALIDPRRSTGKPAAPGVVVAEVPPLGMTPEIPATSHMVIVDATGDVLSFTTTIEAPFGSRLMARGFLLNNELTDFSFLPEAGGRAVANRIEPGKRPRSSMSPTIVFDAAGHPVLAAGSAGGSTIIGATLKVLIGVLDWNLSAQAAVDLPNVLNRNGPTEIERDRSPQSLADALRAMGDEVRFVSFASGLHAIRIGPAGMDGGADPRRDGVALGD